MLLAAVKPGLMIGPLLIFLILMDKLVIKNRPGHTGGGVCFYVHSRDHMSVCDDIVLDDNHSDSLFIEINLHI